MSANTNFFVQIRFKSDDLRIVSVTIGNQIDFDFLHP